MYVVRAYIADYLTEGRWKRKYIHQDRFAMYDTAFSPIHIPTYYVGTMCGRNLYTTKIEHAAQFEWPGQKIAEFDLVGRPVKYDACVIEAVEREICG